MKFILIIILALTAPLSDAAFHDHKRRVGDANWSEPFRYVIGGEGGDDDGQSEREGTEW